MIKSIDGLEGALAPNLVFGLHTACLIFFSIIEPKLYFIAPDKV